MLTGDKVETATSIAISSGLKARKNYLFFMRELTSSSEVINQSQQVQKAINNTTIIIDGRTLETVLNSQEAGEAFFNTAI